MHGRNFSNVEARSEKCGSARTRLISVHVKLFLSSHIRNKQRKVLFECRFLINEQRIEVSVHAIMGPKHWFALGECATCTNFGMVLCFLKS